MAAGAKRPRSAELFARATAIIPGGVNSPVRAFGSVGGTPVFMASGSGAYLTDVDGHRYVDLVCSWGPMILGHAHPDVVRPCNRRQSSARRSARRQRRRLSWRQRSPRVRLWSECGWSTREPRRR